MGHPERFRLGQGKRLRFARMPTDTMKPHEWCIRHPAAHATFVVYFDTRIALDKVHGWINKDASVIDRSGQQCGIIESSEPPLY